MIYFALSVVDDLGSTRAQGVKPSQGDVEAVGRAELTGQKLLILEHQQQFPAHFFKPILALLRGVGVHNVLDRLSKAPCSSIFQVN